MSDEQKQEKDRLGRVTASTDPLGKVMTFTYDANGNFLPNGPEAPIAYDGDGRVAGPSEPRPPAPSGAPAELQPLQPLLRHRFGFRLSGSEAQEQSLPCDGHWPDECIVAIEHIRAYVTRDAESVPAANAIADLQVEARLQLGRILCTAHASDFQSSELLVVEVDVALYAVIQ